MNKDELKDEIQKIADEKNVDLPNGWYNRGEEKLTILLNELKGEAKETDKPETIEVKVERIEKTPQNPFGEEMIDVMIPIDPQNKAMKTTFFAINGKAIEFPLGKKTKMPKSFYAAYMDSQEAYRSAQEKQTDHRYKEL